MREFLPAHLGDLNWSSRERNLSDHLAESMVSGFVIHLRISLSEVKGEAFMGALGVDRMEDHPVVKMEGDMEVVIRKLDSSHLCFSLNFYILMFLSQFPSMFFLLTHSQSFFSLSADYPRHSRRRRSKIQFD